MAQEKIKPVVFDFTAPVRLIFPNLFTPKAFKKDGQDKGEPKFGSVLMFGPDHPDFTNLRKAAGQAYLARWPGDAEGLKRIRAPWQSHEQMVKQKTRTLAKEGKTYANELDFAKGQFCLKANTKFQPQLCVILNGQVVDLDTVDLQTQHKDKFYMGVEAMCRLELFSWEGDKADADGNYERGVTAYLMVVLTLNKGEKIGGGRQKADTKAIFSGYLGGMSATDPTADDLAGVI